MIKNELVWGNKDQRLIAVGARATVRGWCNGMIWRATYWIFWIAMDSPRCRRRGQFECVLLPPTCVPPMPGFHPYLLHALTQLQITTNPTYIHRTTCKAHTMCVLFMLLSVWFCLNPFSYAVTRNLNIIPLQYNNSFIYLTSF